MNSTGKWIAGITKGALVLAMIACFAAPARADKAAAEAAYKQKCAMCHGADGKGKEAMKTRDLSSTEVQKQSDEEISGIITNGKGKMPAYKAMTADQVKDMVAFIRSLKK